MYLITNGKIFTRDEEEPFIENGAIVVDGSVIQAVGLRSDLEKKFPDAHVIDAKGQLIMPALINTHNHIYSTFARGLSIPNYSPDNFTDILEGLWWTIDNHLTLEDTKYSAIASYIHCIENGVTTIFDHHASYAQIAGSLDVIGRVAKEFGIRSCLSYEISDRHGEAKMQEAVKENIDFYHTASADPSNMLRGLIGLHASFTLSDETLKYIAKHVPQEAGYHLHIAEDIADVNDSLQKYHMRPVERFHQYGIIKKNSLGIHCVHVSDAELKIIQSQGMPLVHNPESNMGNAVGVPNSMKIYHTGILYGLGTDGYTQDMLESYKVANIIHKHEQRDAKVAWVEIPDMLFRQNALITERHFDIKIGKIKAGYTADIIFVDYDPITPLDATTLNGHILFGMNGSLVTMTMANGRVLMQDRTLVDIDKRELLAQCKKQATSLWNRINKGEK
ncbi:putative aminohydrolase SsnA (plasmid) [Entomospira entomophila]|uniref:Aminohydrolase SsnA n=1 Tax=Entomospira entomophila TaxID=2719988 RepID=A0A968GD93_9SPIO|nr:putative aminohydrolase SsnA [Entomospira entomophilus]NIZ41336.1 putative aminohydrolase SsnA [Entomospira entomophilus]WDI36253.1 putative aminohydrolase SsnA [Entomospira entomophilus]